VTSTRCAKKLIRGLILPGQRRLHMKDENDQRKRSIAAAITSSDVRATIYTAERRYRTERDSRAACLQALVADIATRGDTILVLEQDDSLIPWDRRHLYDLARQSGWAKARAIGQLEALGYQVSLQPLKAAG